MFVTVCTPQVRPERQRGGRTTRRSRAKASKQRRALAVVHYVAAWWSAACGALLERLSALLPPNGADGDEAKSGEGEGGIASRGSSRGQQGGDVDMALIPAGSLALALDAVRQLQPRGVGLAPRLAAQCARRLEQLAERPGRLGASYGVCMRVYVGGGGPALNVLCGPPSSSVEHNEHNFGSAY